MCGPGREGSCPGAPGALEIILAFVEAGRSGEARAGDGRHGRGPIEVMTQCDMYKLSQHNGSWMQLVAQAGTVPGASIHCLH